MTSESRSLVLRPQTQTMSLAEQKEFAKWAVASRKFKNIRNPMQAMILMQYGRELGFGPATALQSVYEVGGIPSLKGSTIAARIKTVPWQDTNKPRYDYYVETYTDQKAVVKFFERDDDGKMQLRGSITYTMEDAKRAGHIKNDTYRKFPRNMLFWRALTEGARVYCPDCLGGIAPYTPDELGAVVDEDGTPVETVEDADFEVKLDDIPLDGNAEEGITEEELAAIQQVANKKNLCLPDVMGGLGADPNDLRGMTRSQYEAAVKFIENK